MPAADLAGLLPPLVDAFTRTRARCASAGIDLREVDGFRSPMKQIANFQKGRAFDPEHGWHVVDHALVVTNALPAQAPHCRGAAIDGMIFENGKPLTMDPHLPAAEAARQLLMYTRAGEIGESEGLVWGGRFKSIKDYDHFELPGWRDLPMPPGVA